jgi:hypothetical protein
MKKEIKFAPGCFNNFEGSQEELDTFVEELTALLNSEEFAEANILVISEDDLFLEEQGINFVHQPGTLQ